MNRWADEQMSNFSLNTPNFFEPNSIRLRIFSSRILLVFFQTELDSVRNFFSVLKQVFLFPNRIQFGSENFIEYFKIDFPNRIGIGSETDTV